MKNNLDWHELTVTLTLAENALRLNTNIDPIYNDCFKNISQEDAILIMKYFYMVLLPSLEKHNAIKILDKENYNMFIERIKKQDIIKEED